MLVLGYIPTRWAKECPNRVTKALVHVEGRAVTARNRIGNETGAQPYPTARRES